MLAITTSSSGTFRECPRKYLYGYVQRRVPRRESSALSFGKAWHSCLELYWKLGLDAAVNWLMENASTLDPFQAAMLAAMFRYYNPPIDEYEVVDVETNFTYGIRRRPDRLPLRSVVLEGRRDGLLRRKRDQRLIVLEHKTTSDDIVGYGPYWQRLSVDAQVGNYCLAAGANTVLYDVARKPNVRPKKDETPDMFETRCGEVLQTDPAAFYQIRTIEKSRDDLAQSATDLYQTAKLMQYAHEQGFFPRHGNACRNLYGTCAYLDVCCGTGRLDDEEKFRTKEAVNEELK